MQDLLRAVTANTGSDAAGEENCGKSELTLDPFMI
jgi:hypothetical protein